MRGIDDTRQRLIVPTNPVNTAFMKKQMNSSVFIILEMISKSTRECTQIEWLQGLTDYSDMP